MKTKNHLIENTQVIRIHRDETLVLTLLFLQLLKNHQLITAFIAGQAATQHTLKIGDYVFAGIEYLAPSVGRLVSYQPYSPLQHADNLEHKVSPPRYINYTPTGSRVDCFRCFYHVSRSAEQAARGQVALEGDNEISRLWQHNNAQKANSKNS